MPNVLTLAELILEMTGRKRSEGCVETAANIYATGDGLVVVEVQVGKSAAINVIVRDDHECFERFWA